jgi:hypothetical protein
MTFNYTMIHENNSLSLKYFNFNKPKSGIETEILTRRDNFMTYKIKK